MYKKIFVVIERNKGIRKVKKDLNYYLKLNYSIEIFKILEK